MQPVSGSVMVGHAAFGISNITTYNHVQLQNSALEAVPYKRESDVEVIWHFTFVKSVRNVENETVLSPNWLLFVSCQAFFKMGVVMPYYLTTIIKPVGQTSFMQYEM